MPIPEFAPLRRRMSLATGSYASACGICYTRSPVWRSGVVAFSSTVGYVGNAKCHRLFGAVPFYFWKGRYFVSIITFDKSRETRFAASDSGKAIAGGSLFR
jgi:hypothetical protein